MEKLEISFDELDTIIHKENQLNRGSNLLNLSPYLVILQSIINQKPDKIKIFFSNHTDDKIFISNEIDFQDIQLNPDKIFSIN